MHKILGLVVLVGIIAVSYFAITNRGWPSEQPYSGPVEKIRVGNVGEYTIFNLIAKEKGFFEQNGLDAEIKEYSSGPAAIEAMQKGEVDFNVAADFVGVRSIFNNKDLRILAQVNRHRVFQLAVRKDKGILNPVDLKGKRIGVTKHSAGEYFLGDFLSLNGMSISDVIMVDLTPNEMLSQFDSGAVDGISLFEPHIYNLRKTSSPDKLAVWEIQGDQNLHALIYTTKDFIAEHPDTTERYMRSLVKAESYFKSNQQSVKDFISKRLNYEKEYVDYSWPRSTHEIGLKQEMLLGLESGARWVIKNRLTEAREIPNYLDYIYFDALEKIKPESVNITH